jgi:hypothetical protein
MLMSDPADSIRGALMDAAGLSIEGMMVPLRMIARYSAMHDAGRIGVWPGFFGPKKFANARYCESGRRSGIP